jgi:hypothetical protein
MDGMNKVDQAKAWAAFAVPGLKVTLGATYPGKLRRIADEVGRYEMDLPPHGKIRARVVEAKVGKGDGKVSFRRVRVAPSRGSPASLPPVVFVMKGRGEDSR